MKRVIILGAGKSGQGASLLLQKQNYEVLLADRTKGSLRDDPSLSLEGVSLLLLSPGVSVAHPLVEKAKTLGIRVTGEIEWGLLSLPCQQQKKIAITGTNGKTTTVLLLEHLLRSAGRKARALGNVGASLCEYALSPDPEEILIVEVSSFQLETLAPLPWFDAALILNITPNHLDRHTSMQEYADCKLKLQHCLKKEGTFFVSRQVQETFSLSHPLQLITTENAAISLALHLGVDSQSIQKALPSFCKPPHRMEWVAEIDQVTYYNDSKASNVDAVIHALSLVSGPVILLAGGVDKGSSYQPWIAAFAHKVKALLLFGAAAGKMERELAGAFSLVRVETLAEAVEEARRLAKSGDQVLLSPGCSSFDQFANYEERGQIFRNLVRKK
ncbi:MAG: UDP-N-acetylmuramoyl-L-alanine--D-glutamate ligase [Verrucomicrobiota bacterium]|nr:UDP-N-acetylmuramoyl-L-alanine--D-glutamate ligase [Verrucomicrobiota bacterium]